MPWIDRSILLVLLCVVGQLAWPSPPSPTSAEIRLDTGDLRYLRGDLVIDQFETPEPYRSTLLKAAGNSSVLRNEWHRCATFPLRGSNHGDWMCRDFYLFAATWMTVDRRIGIHVAEDFARYIERTDAEESLPESFALTWIVDRRRDGTLYIPDGWWNDQDIRDYLQAHSLLE